MHYTLKDFEMRIELEGFDFKVLEICSRIHRRTGFLFSSLILILSISLLFCEE